MNTIAFHLARHESLRRCRSLNDVTPVRTVAVPSSFDAAYPFASDRDFREYRRAKANQPIQGVFSPITIVSGDRLGTGKTMLTREIITAIHGDRNPICHPNDLCEDRFRRAYSAAVADGDGYLWIDDALGRLLRFSALAFFASATEVPVRKLFQRVAVPMPNNVRIYISGNLSGAIPENIARRSRIINLALG